MALINCPECGKEISDKATTCPNCGCPVAKRIEEQSENQSGHLSYMRIMFSILLIVTAVFVIYQSFFAGLSNALNATGNLDGTLGLMFALLEILFGIMGIVTAKTKNENTIKILSISMAIIGLLYARFYHGIYEDLKIWAWFLVLSGVIFGISTDRLFKQKNRSEKKKRFPDSQKDLPEKIDNRNIILKEFSQGENAAYSVILILFIIMVAAIVFMVFYRTVINPV